ncbi:MAG TPA: hypothetical protein DCK98_12580 [Chloroflexi bacterium]|nr:hypothetical protein [Chloroflexota bacterium]HAL28308.1 hypothetical protein [Chloroflexota bacterium]
MARRVRAADRLRRVIVLGARGFFGAHAVRLLRAAAVPAVRLARADADAEDRASLRSALHPNDVILDAAGPFQTRSTVLLDVALELGADLVDLSDSLSYARSMRAREDEIAERGIAVLTGCSAISAVAATLVRESAVGEVRRVDAWLAPASRDTATVATARAFLASVSASTWNACDFAQVRGMRVDSGLSVQLPAIWPSLAEAAFWVDPHTRGAAALVELAARSSLVRRAMDAAVPFGLRLARLAGTHDGIFAVRIEGSAGVSRWIIRAPRGSYLLALGPATIAVRRLASGKRGPHGLVPADEHVSAEALFAYLEAQRITVERI